MKQPIKPDLTEAVRDILTRHTKARDNDSILIGFYLKERHPEVLTGAATDLLRAWLSKDIPSLSSISRIRRKVQREEPTLRGADYSERQEYTQDWKRQLGYATATTK